MTRIAHEKKLWQVQNTTGYHPGPVLPPSADGSSLCLIPLCLYGQMGLARSPYQINPVPEKLSDGLGRSAWKPLEEGLGIIPEEPLDINLEQGSGSETGQ